VAKNYPEYMGYINKRIARPGEEIPGTMSRFVHLHTEAVKEGALSSKERSS
jgi:hypothetical protein